MFSVTAMILRVVQPSNQSFTTVQNVRNSPQKEIFQFGPGRWYAFLLFGCNDVRKNDENCDWNGFYGRLMWHNEGAFEIDNKKTTCHVCRLHGECVLTVKWWTEIKMSWISKYYRNSEKKNGCIENEIIVILKTNSVDCSVLERPILMGNIYANYFTLNQ